MIGITILSDRRASKRGETLIEIMASIMVLSIGLVGVLAAIPFGGFRMSQMTEADNSAAVGRNAVRTIRVNGWARPESWLIKNPQNGSYVSNAGSLLYRNADVDYIDSTVPFLLDPLGSLNFFPYSTVFSPAGGYSTSLVHVAPMPQDENGVYQTANLLALTSWYDYLFYQQDDLISGYYASEDEAEFRPRVETEEKALLDGGAPEVPAFSGRYSWMAFVYPKSSAAYVNESPFSSVTSADFDAVVFHDRIVGDEKAFAAKVDGSGYQGGSVTIDLSTCRNSDNNVANGVDDYNRVREQLSQTRYIMLAGPDDFPKASSASPTGSVFPTVARWYKIANFANVDDDHVRLTLIGANTPANWADGGAAVTAIFYPGVIGVYSGSATF